MPNGTPLRSDSASQAAELRPERSETPIVAFARLLGHADDFFTAADKQSTRRNHVAFRAVHDGAFAAMTSGYVNMLDLIPQGDDRDLMILAGHAAMMADQLNDIVPEGPEWAHADRLTKGVAAALTAISATLAAKWPAGPESVAPLFPELARSIKRDVAIVEALRADTEGR